MMAGSRIVAGSMIGGIKETQEMIDFAAKHNVISHIEVIPIDYVNIVNIAIECFVKVMKKAKFVAS